MSDQNTVVDSVKPMVMVIDDDRIDQMMYSRVLKRSDLFSIIISHRSAADALAQMVNDPGMRPDLILLDINMPRMNGFEFLDAARQTLPHGFIDTVVVMLTTSLDPRDTARAEEYEEIRHYLNKPLTAEDVEQLVVNFLQLPQIGTEPVAGVAGGPDKAAIATVVPGGVANRGGSVPYGPPPG